MDVTLIQAKELVALLLDIPVLAHSDKKMREALAMELSTLLRHCEKEDVYGSIEITINR